VGATRRSTCSFLRPGAPSYAAAGLKPPKGSHDVSGTYRRRFEIGGLDFAPVALGAVQSVRIFYRLRIVGIQGHGQCHPPA
jgi:hypothetical protein